MQCGKERTHDQMENTTRWEDYICLECSDRNDKEEKLKYEKMENQIKYMKDTLNQIINDHLFPPFEPPHASEIDNLFKSFVKHLAGDWIDELKPFDKEDKEWYKYGHYDKYQLTRESFSESDQKYYFECNCKGFFKFLGHAEPNGESSHYICCSCGKEFYIM